MDWIQTERGKVWHVLIDTATYKDPMKTACGRTVRRSSFYTSQYGIAYKQPACARCEQKSIASIEQ